MIDLYYWPTPNGWKVSILLEELAIEYNTIPVEISAGDQFTPEFLAISPNAKMPAIVDHSTDTPTTVFESGAILYYLAEKHQRFIPDNPVGKKEALEWLFWQTGNQGPMGGQLSHFVNYAPEGEDYSRARYLGEYQRNLAVLERRLTDREYLLGDTYSIADIVAFPWVLIAKPLSASLDEFPKVSAWRSKIKDRPAVRRGVDLLKDQQNRGQHNAQNNKLLFNQSADHFLKKD